MTVVKSFSRYWMSCSPIILPAFDAELDSALELPTGEVDMDNNTSIFRDSGEKRHDDWKKTQGIMICLTRYKVGT